MIEMYLTKIIKTFVKSLFNLFKSPSKLVFKLTYLTILNPQIIIIKYADSSVSNIGKRDKKFTYMYLNIF